MPLVRNAAFLSLSPAWEKNPFPSIIEDAYTPRNTDKGANKCCPVDTIVLIRILNTAQWTRTFLESWLLISQTIVS